MPRLAPSPALSPELYDHAQFLVGKYRKGAQAKVDERIDTLVKLGGNGMIADWRAIGDEIANLLSTDSARP